MPEHERRIVVRRVDNARLVDRAAGAGRARLNDGTPSTRVSDSSAVRRSLFASRMPKNTVVKSSEMRGARSEATRIPAGKSECCAGSKTIFFGVGSVRAREAQNREQRVARKRVDLSAKHGDRQSAVDPREAAIERAIRIDRANDVRAKVAKLHAVPDLIARVDRVCETFARIVEAEFRDVANVDRVARRQAVENEVSPIHSTGRRSRAAAPHLDPPRPLPARHSSALPARGSSASRCTSACRR